MNAKMTTPRAIKKARQFVLCSRDFVSAKRRARRHERRAARLALRSGRWDVKVRGLNDRDLW